MEIEFTDEALKELKYWQKTSRLTLERIKLLLADCAEHPEKGIGKPERLRYELSGLWSRRIDNANRLVYRFDETVLTVISLRYHYKK